MKFGESHKFMSFSKYKILHEDNLPVGEVTTQARLHQGYLNSSIMRIIHEIHGLVTPYSPYIIFQEERLSNIYQAFSPQEYNVLKNNLSLATVNKDLALEKATKTIQWKKRLHVHDITMLLGEVIATGGKDHLLWYQERHCFNYPQPVILLFC